MAKKLNAKHGEGTAKYNAIAVKIKKFKEAQKKLNELWVELNNAFTAMRGDNPIESIKDGTVVRVDSAAVRKHQERVERIVNNKHNPSAQSGEYETTLKEFCDTFAELKTDLDLKKKDWLAAQIQMKDRFKTYICKGEARVLDKKFQNFLIEVKNGNTELYEACCLGYKVQPTVSQDATAQPGLSGQETGNFR